MRFTRARVIPVLLLALAGAGIVALQSPAEAAVTTSTITVPANGQHYLIDATHPESPVPVIGTTNGTTGDFVDINCYVLGSTSWQDGASHVPVAANGSFSTTMPNSTPYGSCRLRAVPDNTPAGSNITGFSGPVVTTEWKTATKIDSGPNAGKTVDYYIAYQGTHALNDYTSATHAGLWDTRLSDANGFSSNYLWYANANLRYEGGTRGRLQVDGRNAYGPNSASAVFADNAGLPSLTFSASRAATSTTIRESNPIVRCPAAAPFPPTAGSCPKFVTTGVRLERSIVTTDGGRQVHVTDLWRSTDGKSHSISAHYDQQVQGYDQQVPADTAVGLKLPWLDNTFQTFSGVATYPGPSKLANSILVRDSQVAASGDFTLPRGAVTFDFPVSVYRNEQDKFTMKASTFSVPAGGYRKVRQSFAIGTTDAEVLAKAAANEVRINPYRADAQIKKSGASSFKGNNVYNTTGASQYWPANVKRSHSVTFLIAVQNDGTRTQTFKIKGNGAPSGFSVKYLLGSSGSTSVTSSVIQGTLALHSLAPGATKYIRLVVTVKAGTSIGKVGSWLVTATPTSDSTRKDAVRATVKVVS